MEKNRPPSGNFDVDFLGGSSRNRKSSAMDIQGAVSESIFQYCTPRESNHLKASLLSGAQVEENSRGLCLNQPNSSELTTLRHLFEENYFNNQNSYPGSWLNCNVDFHGNGTKNISNTSSHMPPRPLEYKGLFDLLNMPVGESVVVSNWQPQMHNMLGPNEAYAALPFSKPYDAHTGKPQVASPFEEIESLGIQNHVTDKMPRGMCNGPLKNVSTEILQQSFLKPKVHSDDLDGKSCSQEDNNSGSCYELRQSNHCLRNGGTCDAPTVGAAFLGSPLFVEQNQNNRLLQNEVQFGSTGSLGVHLGELPENKEQYLGDFSVKIREKIDASDVKNVKHPLLDESSNASPINIIENGQKNDQTEGSLRSDEKSKSHFGKPASVVAEKLWEGSLQLNSSVTVSAVAFFKSGEKLLDTNWCESVEVKGKVRLEAFEKYIQDLPRSRNRGLMVISLCWKDGSSETGLAGMKEVAKGYKKGVRVGFAQLSPGIDLYICPRSDAIITILAKYGFFKGMAAVEDNQDSMIGCVVWRKNRTSSNSVVKKPETKSNALSEQPLNSPSVSPMRQALEKHLSVTHTAQASIAPASVTASSTIECADKDGSESKNINSSKTQIEINNSLSGPNSLLTASVPNDSTSHPVVLRRPSGFNSASLQVPQGDSSELEAHPTCSSGLEQLKTSLELQEPIMPFSSGILKEPMPSSDDDDLPEFDFRTACGISPTNIRKPSVSVLLDKKLMVEGIRNADRSVRHGMPNLQVMPVSSQISERSKLYRLPLTTNEGIPPLKKIRGPEPQISVFPRMEERSSVQNKVTTTPVSATVFAPRKNLFDDDDMPEWCPPELQRQSLTETARLPATMHSQLPNSVFQNSARGPPRAVPSSSPAATRPPLPYQACLPTFHCPTTKAPQPRPLRMGPTSSLESDSTSILGPPPSLNHKPPFYRADKRGWRP